MMARAAGFSNFLVLPSAKAPLATRCPTSGGAEEREIGEIFVGRETPPICRSEARWKLEGEKRKPKLVFWRETKDCEGNKGWVVVVG